MDKSQNLLFTGRFSNNSPSFIIKTDTQLNVLLSNEYSHSQDDVVISRIRQFSNKDYLLGGLIATWTTTNDIFGALIRIDSLGQIKSSRLYSFTSWYGLQIRQININSADEVFASSGTIGTLINPTFITIIKTDINGDTIQTHDYRGSWPYDFVLAKDENPVFLMQPYQYSFGYNSILLKTDFNGFYSCNELNEVLNVIQDSLFTTNAFSLITLNDSIFPLSPVVSDSIFNLYEMDYCLYTSINDIPSGSLRELKIFPNPFSDNLNITTNDEELLEVNLYDILSRSVLQQKFTSSISLNTFQLAKGIYIYEVRNKNGVIKAGKVVKQ